VAKVIDSGWWLGGDETRLFEEEWAEFCEVPFCLGVANGTDGLELALRVIGAAEHEIVTVANAGGYTTTACRLVGAHPSYVDVDPGTLTMDVDAAVAAVQPQTKAIVATHLFGNVVDVDALRSQLAAIDRSDVVIIEDGSQAHGAALRGRRVGSLGDLAVFSFYPTKNLGALGDAGAVVCHDGAFHERLVALHQYGWTERYRSQFAFGRNSRMDELQAAVLRVKLPLLDEWNAERRRIGELYATAVMGSEVRLVSDTSVGVVHLAVVRSSQRDQLREHLADAAIATGVHFPILDPDQPSQSDLPSSDDGLTRSRAALEEILTLPCFPGMLDEEKDRVAEALSSFQPEVG
jgi:dTDP-4-amino-4,6-dideoxygalactose transaminase